MNWFINNLQIHTMKEEIVGIDLGNDKIRVSLLTNGPKDIPNEIFKFDNQIGYINGKRKTCDDAAVIVCLIFNYLKWKLTNIDERKSKLSC